MKLIELAESRGLGSLKKIVKNFPSRKKMYTKHFFPSKSSEKRSRKSLYEGTIFEEGGRACMSVRSRVKEY